MAATLNPFDLLQDADADDPSLLLASVKKSAVGPTAPASTPAPAKFPSKPAPPHQAVREARNNDASRRGGGFGRGGSQRGGRGGHGSSNGLNREYVNGEANMFAQKYGGGGAGGEFDSGKQSEERAGKHGYNRQPFHPTRQAGYANGDAVGEERRTSGRMSEQHSGTGRGYEVKRDGVGRGNWRTTKDDVIGQESNKNANVEEKVLSLEVNGEQEIGAAADAEKDKKSPTNEQEEKEAEDKEMTLEEYEEIREEKRKALLALKTEERKVEADKEFESMKQLSIKKDNDEVFIKLGSDKETTKKRENDQEERAKKSLSINEFLKPAEGEKYHNPGGRGRGRGRGDRGGLRGGYGGRGMNNYNAPSIGDPGQFPTLGGK